MKKNNNFRILWLLLMGIGIFNILDYYLTLEVIGQGHEEANPLVNAILHTVYFPILKLKIIPLVLFGLWLIRKHISRRVMPFIWIAFLSYFSLMVYFKVVFL